MNPIAWLGFILSGCVFASIFLVSIIVYGGDLSRQIAVAAALFACMSQFVGQDTRHHKVSIYIAYVCFALSAFALFAFSMGR